MLTLWLQNKADRDSRLQDLSSIKTIDYDIVLAIILISLKTMKVKNQIQVKPWNQHVHKHISFNCTVLLFF